MRWIIVLLAGCSGDAANPEPGDTGSSDTDADAADDVAPPDDISDVMASVVDRHGVPSIVGAVMKGDRLAALGVAGVRKDGDSTASEAADRYHLGSCTKAMTATLLGTLVQDGTMYWDTTMSVAFPDIDLHPDYENVTLTMMLQHMGGAWGNINDYPKVASALWEDGDPVEQRAWLAEQVLSQPPEYDPGESWSYSNTGYMIVGAAMEAATGTSWEVLMQERIFAPLGMAGCGFGPPDDGSLSAPWGHTTDGDPVNPSRGVADNPPAFGPAGTVHCSMKDWGRFAAAHLDGAQGESTWLDETIFQRLHAVGAQSYAMGWIVTERSWAQGAAYSHAGSNTMFYSVIWLAPELDTAWLVSTNHGDGLSATDDALNRLIKTYAE